MFKRINTTLITIATLSLIAVGCSSQIKNKPMTDFEKNSKWNVISVDQNATDKNQLSIWISKSKTNPDIELSTRSSIKTEGVNNNIWYGGINLTDNSETFITKADKIIKVINSKNLDISGPTCYLFQVNLKLDSGNQYTTDQVTNRITTECKYQNMD